MPHVKLTTVVDINTGFIIVSEFSDVSTYGEFPVSRSSYVDCTRLLKLYATRGSPL